MATQNIFNLTDTWNAGGTTFTAIKMNATDTASAAGSMLIDLQVGGASQFKVTKAGAATITTIELGNASDTTLARSSAGVVTIEGVEITTNSGTQSLSNKTFSSPTLSGTVAGAPTLSGNWTWSSAGPTLRLIETGAAANNKNWVNYANGSTLIFAAETDVGGLSNWLAVTRSGGTPTGINLTAAVVQIGGVAIPTISSIDTLSNKTLSGVTIADATNIILNTTTGTKIGTATSQKLGFFNQTPVVQPTAVADATTAVDVITRFNELLTRMRNLGLIAT